MYFFQLRVFFFTDGTTHSGWSSLFTLGSTIFQRSCRFSCSRFSFWIRFLILNGFSAKLFNLIPKWFTSYWSLRHQFSIDHILENWWLKYHGICRSRLKVPFTISLCLLTLISGILRYINVFHCLMGFEWTKFE